MVDVLHRALLAFVFVVVGITGAAAQAQSEPAPLNLRPQWQPGQTARYEIWGRRVRSMEMSVGGRSRQTSVTIDTTGEITWTVDRVKPDGGATCIMTLDWMTATITPSEGEVQRNDSRRAQGDAPMVHDLLRAMAGVPLTVEVAPDGSIEDVRGVDAIRRRAQHEEMVPEELDFIESANDLATVPDVPAALEPGDTWQAEYRWTHEMGFLHHDVTYTLAGVEHLAGIPVATVEARGDLELEVDRSKMPDNAPPIDVKLVGGDVRSQIMFDLQRHETVGRNTVQRTTIDVAIRLPQQTISQRTQETVQSQALRVAEQ